MWNYNFEISGYLMHILVLKRTCRFIAVIIFLDCIIDDTTSFELQQKIGYRILPFQCVNLPKRVTDFLFVGLIQSPGTHKNVPT